MIDFVLCTDKNYLKGYGVLMLSILRFAPPHVLKTLRFHILSDDLDDADKAILQGIAARREGTEVRFYAPLELLSKETLDVIDERLGKSRFKRATYYRILAADLLPHDVHRALYLDGDMVCTGNLDELFALDLKGRPLGACIASQTSEIWIYNILDYPPEEGYYGSAALLFDLDIWRSEGIRQKMLDYLAANVDKLFWHDQTLINAVLHGRIFPLDYSYNMGWPCFNVFYWLNGEKNKYFARDAQYLPKSEWPALRAAVERPRIVHFFGGTKPWHRESSHPFAPVWRYFYAQSPWANEPLQWQNPPTAKKRIKRLGRKLFEALHLVEKREPAGIPYPEEVRAIAQDVLDRLREEDKARL